MALPPRKGRLQRILGFFARQADAPPVPDVEIWLPGDMAECIGTGNWSNLHEGACPGPRAGEQMIVRDVSQSPHPLNVDECTTFLHFARFGNRRYEACRFRKLALRADAAEAADAAFLEQMRPAPALSTVSTAIRPIANRPRRIFP